MSAPWLTQLEEVCFEEEEFSFELSYKALVAAIKDDAGVFGRLRRLGCDVQCRMMPMFDWLISRLANMFSFAAPS